MDIAKGKEMEYRKKKSPVSERKSDIILKRLK